MNGDRSDVFPAFSYAIKKSKYRPHKVAFLQWHNEQGEAVSLGVLHGMSNEEELRRAAETAVLALNANIGHWEDAG